MDQRIRETIKSTLEKYNLKSVSIFGSYARGEENENSDLDILISLNDDLNLLEIIGMEQELEDILGMKVQIITDRSIKPQLKEYIYHDLIPVI